jgi:hypothetical protein
MKWIAGVCLVAGLVGAMASITIPAATVTPDLEVLKLYPRETLGIAHVDAAALRNSSLVQELLKSGLAKDSELTEFSEATGIVLERDIDEVTAGMTANKQVLAVVKARYDRLRLEQFLRDKNVRADTYQGWQIYSKENNRNDPVIALVDNFVLIGNEQLVRGAIERKAAPGASVLDNNEVMDAVNTIEAGNQIWAAGRITADQLPLPRRRPAQADELLKSLEGGTYQMRIDQDVHVKAEGDFANLEHARALTDMARGFISVARLQLAQAPDMLKLLDGIRVDATGSTVIVNFDAPGDLIQKFRPNLERHRGQ